MPECDFCGGDPDADHRLTINAPRGGKYKLSYGSMIRKGVLKQPPRRLSANAADGGSGRIKTHRVEIGGQPDVWVFDGPINLKNTGDRSLIVSHDSHDHRHILNPGDTVKTSCPTEKRRTTAAGALLGAAIGAGSKIL